MLSRDQVLGIEALGPEEALSVVLTGELSAPERAERLHEIQQVVDELGRRGRRPSVLVLCSENGELHALSLGSP